MYCWRFQIWCFRIGHKKISGYCHRKWKIFCCGGCVALKWICLSILSFVFFVLISLIFNLSYLRLRRYHLFIIFGFFNPKSDHENCQSWAQLSLQFITSRVHSHFWKNISAVDNAQLKHLTIGLHISTQLKRLSQAGKR